VASEIVYLENVLFSVLLIQSVVHVVCLCVLFQQLHSYVVLIVYAKNHSYTCKLGYK